MNRELSVFKAGFDGDIHFDDLHKKLYATDASVFRKIPEAVAFPRSEAAIQQLIHFAIEQGLALIPRTAGTSLAGQCVGEGIIVDVSKYFTEILDLDVENRTVKVQPGVIRDELNAYLHPYGLFFGPNTSTSNRCMIGGMVGNNSSGTTSIKYGVTRDKVIALRTILSNGEVVDFKSLDKKAFHAITKLRTLEGSIYRTIYKQLSSEELQQEIKTQFPKEGIHRRNTGYALDALLNSEVFTDTDEEINLCKLLCGSEGTLAFTTEITLQLDPLPPAQSAMVVAQYDSLEACLNDVAVAMEHDLHTCELMDDIILEQTRQNKKYEPYRFFVEGSPKALLMLEIRAENETGIRKKTNSVIHALRESGMSNCQKILLDDQIAMALELRKAGLGLLGNMKGDHKAVACIEDTAVTLEDLPSYIKEFSQLMEDYGQKAVYYAHAGAGELHLRPILNLKSAKGVDYFRKITSDVAKLVKKYKGSFSGEHGDGIVRGEFLPFLVGEKNYEAMRKIKTIFDPSNLFNPGKIIDSLPMDESLRYEVDRQEPLIDTFMDFTASQGLLRLAENCNGSADCRKTEMSEGVMCPSYHATRDEKDTTRGRANVLREVLTNKENGNKFNSEVLKDAFDLCLSCKACASECPSNVDMAIAKAEFQYQYNKSNGTSFRTRLFGKSSSFNRRASRFPKLANFIFTNPITSGIIKKSTGIALKRSLPIISSIKTYKINQYTNNEIVKNKCVFLFIDEFSNYLESHIAQDTIELLSRLGYEVEIIDQLDSARALISKGFLEEAKWEINKNLSTLKDQVKADKPLIGIEPSAILGFRDEYPRLADDSETAKEMAKHCLLIEEFLASEMSLGHITADQFTTEHKQIKIHIHCHQKALSSQKATFDILNLPENYKPRIIASGCCGMAGSFGYEKEHYKLSMAIGELKLFPSIRKTDNEVLLAANGSSCRHQIKDGTGRDAFHPVTILKNALLQSKTL